VGTTVWPISAVAGAPVIERPTPLSVLQPVVPDRGRGGEFADGGALTFNY
jgi:hypothetical protein